MLITTRKGNYARYTTFTSHLSFKKRGKFQLAKMLCRAVLDGDRHLHSAILLNAGHPYVRDVDTHIREQIWISPSQLHLMWVWPLVLARPFVHPGATKVPFFPPIAAVALPSPCSAAHSAAASSCPLPGVASQAGRWWSYCCNCWEEWGLGSTGMHEWMGQFWGPDPHYVKLGWGYLYLFTNTNISISTSKSYILLSSYLGCLNWTEGIL